MGCERVCFVWRRTFFVLYFFALFLFCLFVCLFSSLSRPRLSLVFLAIIGSISSTAMGCGEAVGRSVAMFSFFALPESLVHVCPATPPPLPTLTIARVAIAFPTNAL